MMIIMMLVMMMKIMISMVNLSRGGEEYADASESHKGRGDAYQAGQRFLTEIVMIMKIVVLIVIVIR